MLDGLDEIQWERLTHYWGTAENVPGEIRALTAPDSATRRLAISNLYEGLCNDSAVSEATVVAVPFLIELVGNDRVGDRHSILGLLGSIARCLRYQERWVESLREHDPAEFKKRGWDAEEGLRLERAARSAVGAGIEQYLALLDEPESAIQEAAMYALAVFPERAPEIVPALWRLVDDDPDPDVRANALLALSEVIPPNAADLSQFDRLLVVDEPLVRSAAALAIAELAGPSTPPKVVPVLCDAITESELVSLAHTLWETDPTRALSKLGSTLIREATGLLFDKLATVTRVADNPLDRATLTAATQASTFFNVILRLHFDIGRIWPSSAPTLTSDRREVLVTILRMDALWEVARSPVSIMRQYGLPVTREELAQYLGTPAPGTETQA